MDFQRLLLAVANALRRDEVEALAFLCTDFLGRGSLSVESASDLFSRLAHQDYLSPERPHLLAELLVTIQRTRLVRDLRLADPEDTGLISPYRKLLYSLSEEITKDDLKNVKFLLNKTLPRRKLDENISTLEVFLAMEHMDILSDTNLRELEQIIESVCPVLKEQIDQFKALQVHRPRSSSFPTQVIQTHQTVDEMTTTSSSEQRQLAERFRASSNTSMDFPDLLPGRVDNEARSPRENETFSYRHPTNSNSEVLGRYPMTAAKRGFCLIINNHNFATSTTLNNREGTMVDEQCLRDVFQWLDFEVEVHRDCKSEKIRSVLQTLGMRDHSQMDCVVCCILSHGQEGGVYGVDGRIVDLKELRRPLNGLQCSSLADKPKLFFIQACQGTSEQKPVYIESDDGLICNDAVVAKESIPCDADFLLAMSTLPSFASFRDKRSGTWFIQSLCQNLVQMVPRECDLVSILTKVNADVSRKKDSTGFRKQMPQPAFTLRKKVIFPIPRSPPPQLPSV